MTRKQRIAAIAAGALAAVFVLALAIAALVDDDADEELTADLTTTTTTTVLVEDTTTTSLELPTTTAPPTSTTATTTPSTTTTRPKPVVDGQGAVLRPPVSPSRRAMKDDDCATLADPGWAATCDRITGDLLWLVATRAAPGGATATRAYVFRRDGTMWAVALEARDDDGSRFAGLNVRVEDLSGDGTPEAAFGFRRTGSTRILALDVVDPPGTVVVHRESPDGSGRVSAGQLDVWEAAGSAYDHLTIRYVDGAWRIVATERVERRAVPPSHF